MDGITNLTEYLIGTIAIILLPGPNSLYCLSVAAQYGAKAAARVIAGILLGDSILILAAVLGAGTLLKTFPALFNLLKLAGGLYLAWLGLNLLKGACLAWQTRRNTQAPVRTLKKQRFFHRALSLSLMNPKAILFFLSFFLQFVRADAPNPALSFLILALILQATSLTYLTFLTFTGVKLTATFARYRLLAAAGMAAVGALFVSFAVRLWTSSLA